MSSCCEVKQESGFWRYRLLWIALVLASAIGLSYVVPFLVPFRQSILMYVRMLFWPMVLGFVLGGMIDYYVPKEYISVFLAGRKRRNIVYAVLSGFLMTLCCHGILAVAVQLYKKGAAPSSVVAFLLASPWANLPLTLILIGFFGPAKAAFIIFSAILTALITGWIFQILEARGLIEANPHTIELQEGFDLGADLKARAAAYRFDLVRDVQGIWRGIRELADMALWWIMIGMSLAAVAGAYVPSHLFQKFLSRSLIGLIVTLLIATVIETCSEGSSPLAFEIYRQTGALGNSLVFLMAGVATDYTEIGLIWATAGRRTALWMPAIAVPIILIFGLLGNFIFR